MSACAEKRCLSARGCSHCCLPVHCTVCKLCTVHLAKCSRCCNLQTPFCALQRAHLCNLQTVQRAHLGTLQIVQSAVCNLQSVPGVHLCTLQSTHSATVVHHPTRVHTVHIVCSQCACSLCALMLTSWPNCALQADLLSSSTPCAATAGRQIVRFTWATLKKWVGDPGY